MITNPSHVDEVRFWGRIRGSKSNYYIAIATRFVGEYESPSKAFFYSTEDFKFKRLPFIIWSLKDFIGQIENHTFIGEPDKVLLKIKQKSEDTEDQGAELPDEEPVQVESGVGEEEVDIGEKKKKNRVKKKTSITELERLSFVVRAIENECAIVPVGAVKIMPNHQLRYNVNFRGCSLANALKIENWMHYRPPQSDEKKKSIEDEKAIYEEKILDALEQDRPKGVWNINSTIDESAVIVRNLYWPGAIGFHKIDSTEFGYCYFGDGIKNHDLPFLI